ncbi:molybdate ABC transporter substrate-binding protein [Elongatibacter sediminis]|uniref:Molybdate ABC transporter substrate-binding protein n=1 Tax=Elongatibacter sediminis TaxID=3119006 RepID=A0AAW9RI52_9GAMM
MIRPFVAALVALLSVHAGNLRAAEVLVAVAANFIGAAEALQPMFERETGHRLVLITGSTGKLHAQISHGAPYEVLLSADAATPARLETEGQGVAGTRFTYALGRLALWSADPERITGDGGAVLTDPTIQHIAIANPELAPYGAAARETLRSLGLWESVQTRLVMGENVGQTQSFVATGAAEVGFVAYSAVLTDRARGGGSHWEVPASLYQPIRQDAILLRRGADNPAATDFLGFLASPAAVQSIRDHGYGVE